MQNETKFGHILCSIVIRKQSFVTGYKQNGGKSQDLLLAISAVVILVKKKVENVHFHTDTKKYNSMLLIYQLKVFSLK